MPVKSYVCDGDGWRSRFDGAAGHQETFEVEERLKTNAAARLEAAKQGRVGFG